MALQGGHQLAAVEGAVAMGGSIGPCALGETDGGQQGSPLARERIADRPRDGGPDHSGGRSCRWWHRRWGRKGSQRGAIATGDQRRQGQQQDRGAQSLDGPVGGSSAGHASYVS